MKRKFSLITSAPLTLIFLGLGLLSPAFSQQMPSEKPKLANANFTFYTLEKRTVYSMGDGEALKNAGKDLPTLYYQNNGVFKEVKIAYGAYKNGFSYRGPVPVDFYTQIPTEENKVEPCFRLNFPVQWNNLLVLVSPGGKNSAKAFCVDISANKLEAGMVRLYNLGSKPIAFKAMEQQAVIKPGKYNQFSISDLEGYYLPLMLVSEHEGAMKLAYKSNLSVNKFSKLLLLATQVDKSSQNWLIRPLAVPEI